MPIKRSQQAATEKYNANTYEDVRLRVPAGRKLIIESMAEMAGLSINGYINSILAQHAGMDIQTWEDPDFSFTVKRANPDCTEGGRIYFPPGHLSTLAAYANKNNIDIHTLINVALADFFNSSVEAWFQGAAAAAVSSAQRGGRAARRQGNGATGQPDNPTELTNE